MSLRFEGSFDFEGLMARTQAGIDRGLPAGMRVIFDASQRMVPYAPKEPGDTNPHLRSTGRIRTDRGGDNTVAITYDGPYARYIHEHLGFAHPHGGQAKYLEVPLLTKGGEALNVVAKVIQEAL